MERDTGPQDYFAVPLARAYEIFRDGIADLDGTKVFVLRMIQARDPSLAGPPFFARFDPDATWITDLKPAFAPRFPYDPAPE